MKPGSKPTHGTKKRLQWTRRLVSPGFASETNVIETFERSRSERRKSLRCLRSWYCKNHVEIRNAFRHCSLWQLDRTPFVLQTTHLWAVKERLWQWLPGAQVICDPELAMIDRYVLPICHFVQACYGFVCMCECAGREWSLVSA
jgi:hypothetical protein